jgi:hypothetical protein
MSCLTAVAFALLLGLVGGALLIGGDRDDGHRR